MMSIEGAMEPAAVDEGLRREGERIAQLIEDLATMAGAPVRQRVDELVRRLVHLYGTGLERLLQIVAGDPERMDDTVRARLRADALLSSLLVLHGIHPDPDGAQAFDPGPEPTAPAAQSGLVQIDVSRTHRGREDREP
jgi:hypothetical protein